MRIQGLIAAAGLSSRMGGFKPFMKLNGFPMIQMTVQSLKNAGIREITVVTGYRAEEMARLLEPLGVRLVENRAYRETDMLASICMGLSSMKDADAVFFLPGDLPLIAPGSMKQVKDRLNKVPEGTQALVPVTGERTSHPPVLLSDGFPTVLGYRGEDGLKGAFASMRTEYMELDDAGTLADADFCGDFARLEADARKYRGVSRDLCEAWYEETGLPEHIQAHCRAVGALAGWMAERLTEHGACLDVELCRSGGCLHDLCRLSKGHEAAAGAFLRERGYLALAEVVERHRGFEADPESVCEEWAIVCLADKLILEDRRVSLTERYRKAFAHNPVKERIRRDVRICQRLKEEFEVMTGEQL